jgi:hypothetical protein
LVLEVAELGDDIDFGCASSVSTNVPYWSLAGSVPETDVAETTAVTKISKRVM